MPFGCILDVFFFSSSQRINLLCMVYLMLLCCVILVYIVFFFHCFVLRTLYFCVVFATLTLFVFWRQIFRTNKKWFRNIYEHLPLISVYVSLIRFLFRIHILCATFTRVQRTEQFWTHISLSSYCHPHQPSGRAAAATICVYVCRTYTEYMYLYIYIYIYQAQPGRHTFNTLRYTFYSWTFAHITMFFPTLQTLVRSFVRSFVQILLCVIHIPIHFRKERFVVVVATAAAVCFFFVSSHTQLEKMPRFIHTKHTPNHTIQYFSPQLACYISMHFEFRSFFFVFRFSMNRLESFVEMIFRSRPPFARSYRSADGWNCSNNNIINSNNST